MKKIKKISILLICTMLLSLIFATCTFANPFAIGYVSMTLGDTVYVTIESNGSTGTYSVSCEGPIYAQDAGGGWLESGTTDGSVSIYAKGIGSGNVYIDYYVSDDNGNETSNTLCINVDVVESTYDGEGWVEPKDDKFDVTVNDVKYQIVTDLTEVTLPKGFTKADGSYGVETVNVAKYVSKDNEEIILYALDPKEDGEIIFMTFNADKAEFKEPKTIKQGSNIYYLLSIPSSVTLPENYEIKEKALNETISANVVVEKNNSNTEFVYIYALANGEEGFYSYDIKEGTIQRCPDLEGRISPKVEVIKEEPKNNVNKTMVIIIGIAAVAVLAMGIILIVVLAKRKKDKKDKEDDDYYYQVDNSYDYDDITEEDETEKSDDIDELDVIDLSDDKEGLADIESIKSEDLEEDDGLDLIDLTKKPKDSDK